MSERSMQQFLERAMREPIAGQMAAAGRALLPGQLLELNRQLLFGDGRQANDPDSRRALIMLGFAAGSPLLGWRFEGAPVNEVIGVICVALGMMAEHMGVEVIEKTASALEVLRRRLRDRSEGMEGEYYGAE
jgi:hypothetical protein